MQREFDFYADRDLTHQERFEKFHRENPRVLEVLVRLAQDDMQRGIRLGMKNIWERARHYVAITTKDPSGFKLNNNYHSRYARLLIETHPEFADLIELRKLRTE